MKCKIILIILFILIIIRILYINIYKRDYYLKKLDKQTKYYTYGFSAPRGRILDINGNIIVDNIKSRVIVYHKNKHITKEKELMIANKLSKYLKSNYNLSDEEKAEYVLCKSGSIKPFVTSQQYYNYEKGIYTYDELRNIAKTFVKNNLNSYYLEEEDKTAKIFSLMNKDYVYDQKIILDNISDIDYFEIINLNLPGISGEYIYKRYYPYKDLLKTILGSVGQIPKEDLNKYIKDGYSLSDLVGISYLEYQYETILKGQKAKYLVNSDGSLKLIKGAKKGEDITLNIDINIENEIEKILKKYIKNTKGKVNTEYYEGSYVLVSTPDGQIKGALGLKIDDKGNFIDATNDIINSSFVLGSVVKAASNTVSYHENVIKRGKKINDACVKLYMNTKKCSYQPLGMVDDITALEKSSNYYQYINALKIMGYEKYFTNMKVNAKQEDFDKYRNIFKSYGLGSKTDIDLPNEKTGIKGNKVAPDLLLNFSIGQYDSYTPVELLSYINTIASKGTRYNLRLNSNYTKKILDNVDINEDDMNRILMGLNNVVVKGTGRGYIKNKDGAGKTGTSETIYNGNKSISTAFVGFIPFENPKYTFIVISPHISSNKRNNNYKVPINRYIISDLTSFLFENM